MQIAQKSSGIHACSWVRNPARVAVLLSFYNILPAYCYITELRTDYVTYIFEAERG